MIKYSRTKLFGSGLSFLLEFRSKDFFGIRSYYVEYINTLASFEGDKLFLARFAKSWRIDSEPLAIGLIPAYFGFEDALKK